MIWKNLEFNDVSGAKFKLTHKTGNKFTVKILESPKEGSKSIANSSWKLSNNEFVMTIKRFEENIELGNIVILQ